MKLKVLLRKALIRLVDIVFSWLASVVPKRKNLIVIGAHNGSFFGDNSAYIYETINREFPELEAVWLTDRMEIVQSLRKNGGKAYLRRSWIGLLCSLQCQVLVCSHNLKDAVLFLPLFKQPKIVYLHHGIPLRKGWLQLKNANPEAVKSTMDKVNYSNVMIAPSDWAARQQNQMFPVGMEAFKMTGLPRTDIFFPENKQQKITAIKQQLGLKAEEKVILYAPTWRPWGATTFFPFEETNLEELHQLLKVCDATILLRPHHIDLNHQENQTFWEEVDKYDRLKVVTHKEVADANELCLIADALITDYSSIYYDFLLCDKPVFFLTYDFDRYNEEIGFYPDFHKVTIGYKPENWKAFLGNMQATLKGEDEYQEIRNDFKNTFYLYLDGQSSKRVVQLIKELL